MSNSSPDYDDDSGKLRLVFEPKVYLASTPAPEHGIAEFLRDCAGASNWESDAQDAGDYLPEVAGRLCYLSFAAPRPGGNKKYLDHIKEVGHGSVLEHSNIGLILTGVSRSLTHELVRHRAGLAYCLAGDVEVYSGSKQRGHFDGVKKKWSMKHLYEMSQDWQLKGRLKLMTVRCFDGDRFVQAKIKGVSCSGEKDIFKVVLADGKQIRCSKDHRFLTPTGWKSVETLVVGEVIGTNGRKALNLDKAWLERRYRQEGALLAEIASEAGCSCMGVRKYLKMYGLQKAQGQGTLGRSPPNKGTRYKTGYKHTEATKALLGEQKRGERNPGWKGDAAGDMAGRLRAQRLFKTRPCSRCEDPKGHRHHKDRNTKNNVPDNIEFLCNSCHKRCHLEEDGPSYYLTVKWVEIASIDPDGREMTYDLEVDHPSHNFVANGFVTHNSQLSQRYVDESDTRFVVPPKYIHDVRNLTDIGQRWLQTIVNCLHEYCCIVSRSIPDFPPGVSQEEKTAARKAAREAARSVLPNATETYIMVTGNARAWRHFLEMRGALGADAEIRRLALAVHKELLTVAPNLFGDYMVESDDEGRQYLKTPWRKV